MVNQNKKKVAVGILDFLNSCIADGTFSSEDKESAEVAIDCISNLFDVTADDKQSLLGDDTLIALISGKSSKTESKTEIKVQVSSSPTEDNPVVTDEQKKEAEKIKLEGNRYMVQKKYQEAVDAYSRALEIDPRNAVYLSNRSAAYSSLRETAKAAEDAKRAIEIDPTYSKAYSRLGLALYSQGDAQGAMKAYEKGLEAEGSNPSDGMTRGFETAKKRVQEELDAQVPSGGDSIDTDSVASERSAPSSSGGRSGGMPDLSSLAGMFGGGGMPDLSSLMSNPQISQMAQSLMSNPDAISSLMNNPQLQRMQESMRNGQMPNFSELMSNPALQDLARNFMGGANRPGDQ